LASLRKENEEDDEFRRAVADAKPLAPRRRAEPHRGASRLFKQRFARRARRARGSLGPLNLHDAIDSGNELAYLGEGLGRDVLRKLPARPSGWVEDELDLARHERHMAAIGVTEFLRTAGSGGWAACASSTAKAAARINASRC